MGEIFAHAILAFYRKYVSRETYVSQGTFSLCTAALFECKKTPHKATFTEIGIKTEII